MPSEDTIRVGAARVHWRRDGSGPPLVFLHGFPLSGETWDAVVQRLRDRFTCWALDLIGLGGSESTADEDHASLGQARAFQRVLVELGVGTYALVGNDTGGWIARELALVDARRVARLVLTNSEIPFHRPPWIPTYQTLAHLPGAGIVLGQVLKLAAFRRSSLAFGGCFHDPRWIDGDFHTRFVEPLLSSATRMDGAMRFLRQMQFARLDEFARLHAELRMPTLLVWGADDPTFPVARARAMAGQFRNGRGICEIARAKLLLHEERPAEVAAAVLPFLESSAAARPAS